MAVLKPHYDKFLQLFKRMVKYTKENTARM